MSVPEGFLCPITRNIMQDPVVDREGNTFERTAIIGWLQQHRTSPLTRLQMSADDLHPNRALRDAIEDYLKTHDENGNVIIASQSLPPLSDFGVGPTPTAPIFQPATVTPAPVIDLSISATESLTTEAFVVFPREIDSSKSQVDVGLCLKLSPPVEGVRAPSSICCVVDVSRSMNDPADVKGEGGKTTSNGLSILDIVKHSVQTIIGLLGPEDTFSLVTFSDVGKVILTPTAMTDTGKTIAKAKVSDLKVENTTNLWDGLKKGLELLASELFDDANGRFCHVVLLTDGVPNVNPPSGELESLRQFKKAHLSLGNCSINTFGFGYELDSKLLISLARETFGQYVFIPDITLVGTVFVHAVSNILSTMAIHVNLDLQIADDQVRIMQGGRQKTVSVDVGSLLYGQNREVFFTLKVPISHCQKHAYSSASDLVRIKTSYFKRLSSTKAQTSELTVSTDHVLQQSSQLIFEVEASKLRDEVVRTIQSALDRHRSTPLDELIRTVIGPQIAKISTFVESVKKALDEDDDDDKRLANARDFAQGILKDLQGEVCLALSKEENVNKWGVHYLPSLALAHDLQIRNNFKDPGVQFYGGKLFQQLVQEGDRVFLTLPPPKPSIIPSSSSTYSSSRSNSISGFNNYGYSMSNYYNQSNPCFSGNSLVAMFGGSAKRVDHIVKGDCVLVSTASAQQFARVVCVVETVIPEGQGVTLARPANSTLLVTSWHPIRVNGVWMFPENAVAEFGGELRTHLDCRSVFSFVLDSHHTMIVGDVECACFGHGFTDNEVIAHEYFGTQRVIADLSSMSGWADGRVKLAGVQRNTDTRRICGLVPAL
eukprot:c11702_g1_i1.p1 GENE.c11702_g1_i1~~c11702_g1_i1.p1  ORF type:complete len:849 (+),score=196.04 c11702_g1_i1:67-2547(+)